MERKNVDIPSLTNYVVYDLLVRGARARCSFAAIIKVNWKVMITVFRNSLYHYYIKKKQYEVP